jgi:hypothetical protein
MAVSYISYRTEDQNRDTTKTPQDERLRNIEPRMIEMIQNEASFIRNHRDHQLNRILDYGSKFIYWMG